MRTSPSERIDQLALVWLAVPRPKSRPTDFASQLKQLANGAEHAKELARASFARLLKSGLVADGNQLKLTEEGRRRALEVLGVAKIPQSRTALKWVKKVLLLRNLGVEPTTAALRDIGKGDVIAARVLVRQHQLDPKLGASPAKAVAVLARRALGLEEKPSLKLEDAFTALFLEGASTRAPQELGAREGSGPESSTVALKLGECQLPEFANQVVDAARSSRTGRWHDAVFISHVWSALRARGDVGISFENFQRRLVEAHQAALIKLSRADLVDVMPAADVSASETKHFGARFHFVRLEQLAS